MIRSTADFLARKVHCLISDTSLKKKLVASYILIIFVPLAISNILLMKELSKSILEYRYTSIRNTIEQVSYNVDNNLNLYSQVSNLIFFNQELNSIIYNDYDSENPLYQIYEAYTTIKDLLKLVQNTNTDLLKIKIFSSNKTLPPDQTYVYGINAEIAGQDWYQGALKRNMKEYYSNINPEDPSDTIQTASGNQTGSYHFYSARTLTFTQGTASPAILVLDVSEKHLYSLIEKEPASNKLYIINDNGYIISSNNRSSISKRFDSICNIDLGSGKESKSITINGSRQLITYTSNSHNWKIVSIIPVNDLFKIPNDMLMLFLSIYLLCSLVSVFLIILFSVILTRRLRLFEKHVKSMETGNFSISTPISGEDEIGMIFKAFNQLILRVKNYLDEIRENELKIRNAEIKALQSQINPHFLYNTMDTIYWLVFRNKNEKAAKMLIDLSRFYKAILSKEDTLVKISEEVDILKRYLSIEMEKLDAEVKVHYFIQEDCRNQKILKFLLQPFLENVLNHAIFIDTKTVNIVLKIHESGDFIIIEIIDDGIGMSREKLAGIMNDAEKSSGYAIYNIKERLKVYYMNNFILNIFSISGIGTKIEIKIPKNP